MADEIRCNTSTLTNDNHDVDGYIKKIRASKAQIENIVKRLDNMWDGDASEAFKARMSDQMNQLENYCVSLESVSNYEKKAVTEYEQCVKGVDGMISSIAV